MWFCHPGKLVPEVRAPKWNAPLGYAHPSSSNGSRETQPADFSPSCTFTSGDKGSLHLLLQHHDPKHGKGILVISHFVCLLGVATVGVALNPLHPFVSDLKRQAPLN